MCGQWSTADPTSYLKKLLFLVMDNEMNVEKLDQMLMPYFHIWFDLIIWSWDLQKYFNLNLCKGVLLKKQLLWAYEPNVIAHLFILKLIILE